MIFSGKIGNIWVEFSIFFFFFSHFGETLNPKPQENAPRTALRLIHIKIFFGGKFLPNGELFKMAKM